MEIKSVDLLRKSWADDKAKMQAVIDAHHTYCETMRKIEQSAWMQVEEARYWLAGQLLDITGENQPVPTNPFRVP